MNPNEQWLIDHGFEKQLDGSFSKPRRTVPRLRPAAAPVLESYLGHAPDDAPPRKAIYPGIVSVRITSYCCGTQRDTDNIFVKYGLDCCRYAGLISSDCPGTIRLEVREERVSTKKEEGFEVLIIPL
jgi:hypothetical protein